MGNFISFKYIALIVLLFSVIILINITKKLTKSYIKKQEIEPHRVKVILHLFNVFYFLFTFFCILIIFGIDIKQIGVLASSVLAVLGVGFFAQWSMLSNITASVILFFFHPMRIGDTIRIVDKEYDFIGEVKNITAFYVQLYIKEGDREITIPNVIVLYRGIELIKKIKAEGTEA